MWPCNKITKFIQAKKKKEDLFHFHKKNSNSRGLNFLHSVHPETIALVYKRGGWEEEPTDITLLKVALTKSLDLIIPPKE